MASLLSALSRLSESEVAAVEDAAAVPGMLLGSITRFSTAAASSSESRLWVENKMLRAAVVVSEAAGEVHIRWGGCSFGGLVYVK